MEHFLSLVKILFVFVGVVICLVIGYEGVFSRTADASIMQYNLVFFPLLVLSVFGARSCLEQGGELVITLAFPLVYAAIALGMNHLAGGPVEWLRLPLF